MYVAMLLGLIGWGIYLGHLPGLFPLPVFVLFVNRFQIGPEERALRSRFGMSYAEYTATVRRWL